MLSFPYVLTGSYFKQSVMKSVCSALELVFKSKTAIYSQVTFMISSIYKVL